MNLKTYSTLWLKCQTKFSSLCAYEILVRETAITVGLCWPRLHVYYWEDHLQPHGGHSVDLTCFPSFLLFSWSFKTFKPDTSDPLDLKTRCAQLEREKGSNRIRTLCSKEPHWQVSQGFVFSAPSLTSDSLFHISFSLPSRKWTCFIKSPGLNGPQDPSVWSLKFI